jgi:hypothetical protein
VQTTRGRPAGDGAGPAEQEAKAAAPSATPSRPVFEASKNIF